MAQATTEGPTARKKRIQKEAHKKASKKVARKNPAAKPKTAAKTTEGLLFDPHKIPTKGKKLASIYKETSEAKSKATGAHKTANDNLIEWMEDTGNHRIPVELGGVRKLLVLDNVDKIKIETAAEPPKADDNGKAS